MKQIVLASNNKGKLAELHTLLAPLGLDLLPQAALNIPEAEEPFHTFVENALAKARHAAQHSGLPALADDAGLCVDAFGGQPGVDTAYYATQFGYPKGDEHNVRALLEQMQGQSNRRAALVSTLEPVLGPIWVWLIHNEVPGIRTIIGGGIVFVALFLHILTEFRRRPAAMAMPAAP